MIYATTKQEIEAKRKAFIRKWRLKCRAVADSLEEAGDKLFTFTRFPQSQWKSIRTTNAIERLHEEFKRRIKTHMWTAPVLTRVLQGCDRIACSPYVRPVDAVALNAGQDGFRDASSNSNGDL